MSQSSVQSASHYPSLPLLPFFSLPLPLNRFCFQPFGHSTRQCVGTTRSLSQERFLLITFCVASLAHWRRPQLCRMCHDITTFQICCLRLDSAPSHKTTRPNIPLKKLRRNIALKHSRHTAYACDCGKWSMCQCLLISRLIHTPVLRLTSCCLWD